MSGFCVGPRQINGLAMPATVPGVGDISACASPRDLIPNGGAHLQERELGKIYSERLMRQLTVGGAMS